MVRATAPLESRKIAALLPKKNSGKNKHAFKSAFKQPCSPLQVARRSPQRPNKTARFSPYRRAPKIKLSPIQEESPDINRFGGKESSAQLNFLREVDELVDDPDDVDSEIGTDFEGWDDETTLVARLQNDAPKTCERDQLVALAHKLDAPMQEEGVILKQYLAHTCAPAAKRVKDVHSILEQRVDVAFGVGVLSFDETCKQMENMALQDEDELKDAYSQTQRNVASLFAQLKTAYEKRDRLWDQLREAIDKSAARTTDSLAALPAELDRAIGGIEKRAKDLAKSGTVDGKAREKMLRDLLAGMQ